MNPLRTPVVLGVAPGVGAGTLAAALHAHDGGAGDIAADIVVCAATEESLLRAARLAVGGARPLLAAVMPDDGPPPARPRLDLAGRRYAGVTVLPHVGAWSGLTRPVAEIGALLGRRPDDLPPAHRAYAAALRTLAAALVGTGLLGRPRPPVVAIPGPNAALPRPVRLAVAQSGGRPAFLPALRPDGQPLVLRTAVPARRVEADELNDLDDEALEDAALLGTR